MSFSVFELNNLLLEGAKTRLDAHLPPSAGRRFTCQQERRFSNR